MAVWRRAVLVLASMLLALVGLVPVGYATRDATATECSVQLFHDDPRLGPRLLPSAGLVGMELRGYNRTGHQGIERFLTAFHDPAANGGRGGWRYPPRDGYVLDAQGEPIRWTQHLMPGTRLDRYGSEFGTFLAQTGLPYTARSIPPQNLVGNPPQACNYRHYLVVRNFTVHAGPVAPWFFQQGGGLQFQLTASLLPGAPANLNVKWLADNGYLVRLR